MADSALFQITLESTTVADRFKVVAQWSQPDGWVARREGSMSLDPAGLDEHATAEAYGEALGRSIFTGKIHELFVKARHETKRRHYDFRVQLAVESPTLQGLRWQCLAGPPPGKGLEGAWSRFGQNPDAPLSLYAHTPGSPRFPAIASGDLRVLVVMASPKAKAHGSEPFDEAAALEATRDALGTIPSVVLGKVPEAAGPPTLDALCQQLAADPFTVLHLVGHGSMDEDGAPAIVLDDARGNPVRVSADELIGRLEALDRLPHLTVLWAGPNVEKSRGHAFDRLAPQLVRRLRVPAVVTMTDRTDPAPALTLGRSFYDQVLEHGKVDLALAVGCTAMGYVPEAPVPTAFTRISGDSLFGQGSARSLPHDALLVALDRLDALFEERAPVSLEQARELIAQARVNPSTLQGQAARDRDRAIAKLEHLCKDVLELSLLALAQGEPPPRYKVACPFVGLRPFTEDDKAFFRGRDSLARTLEHTLGQQSMLALHGTSGSGKSSLVSAGIIPRLRDKTPSLQVSRFRPGAEPLAALDEALAPLSGSSHALLHVDQAEEVFTQCRTVADRAEFFERLCAAAKSCRVILSIRDEFIGDISQDVRNRMVWRRVAPLSADALRDALQEQAYEAGLSFEAGVCEQIWREAIEQPGAMFLAQHLLRGLYEQRHGRLLRIDAYEQLGKLRGAITKTYDAVWGGLQGRERQWLPQLLLELTEVRRRRDSDITQYFLRRISASDLGARLGTEPTGPLRGFLDRLAAAHLLAVHGDGSGASVEIAVEALVHRWDRLATWIAEGTDSLVLRQELEDQAERWEAKGRPEDLLVHTGPRGDRVRGERDAGTLRLGPPLQRYFAACEQRVRRQRQRRTLIATTAAGLTVLLVFLAYLDYRATRDEAAHNERLTQQARAATLEAGNLAAQVQERSYRVQNAAWMNLARAFQGQDPTLELLGLREVRDPQTPGWRQEVLDLQRTPIVSAELGNPGDDWRSARPSPDGTRVLLVAGSDTGGLSLAPADGTGSPAPLPDSSGPVEHTTFSPDGNRVAAGYGDGSLRVWAADGGAPTMMGGSKGAITALSFSPDGQRLLAVADGVVHIWTTSDPSKPAATHRAPATIDHAVFSRDGKRVLLAAKGAIITRRIEQPGADKSSRRSPLPGRITLSPNGRHFLVQSGDTWRLNNGKRKSFELPRAIETAEFSADGQTFLTVSEGTVHAWHVDRPDAPVPLLGPRAPVDAAGYGLGGRRAVTVSGGQVRVWALDGIGATTMVRARDVRATSFSADGEYVVLVADRGVQRWKADGSEAPESLRRFDAPVTRATLGPDAKTLTVVLADAPPLWVDLAEGGKATKLYDFKSEWSGNVVLSADGRRIFSAGGTKLRVGKIKDTTRSITVEGHKRPIAGAAFSADGTLMVSSTGQLARLWRWEPERPRLVADLPHPDGLLLATFVPGQPRVLTVGPSGVSVWDQQGKPRMLLAQPFEAIDAPQVSFAPDGTHVLLAAGHTAWRVSLDDPRDAIRFAGHSGTIHAVGWSSDGQRIVTASEDGTARIWARNGATPPLVLRGHEGAVESAAFSPDGQHVLTLCADTVRVWTIDDALLRARLEQASHVCVPAEAREAHLAESPDRAQQAFAACQGDG